jgi:transposase
LEFESIRLWIKEARESAIEAFSTVADTIDDKLSNVIKYFDNRATNAFAESLNAKIKDFRARLKGVSDIKLFLYRVSLIFG